PALSDIIYQYTAPLHNHHSFPTRRSSDLRRRRRSSARLRKCWCGVGAAKWKRARSQVRSAAGRLRRKTPLSPRAFSPTRRSGRRDRKSTRLNSSHVSISYAVFCLKKKTTCRSPARHSMATWATRRRSAIPAGGFRRLPPAVRSPSHNLCSRSSTPPSSKKKKQDSAPDMSPLQGLIDSHCHLQDPKFDGEHEAVVRRARQGGVSGIVVVGYDLESSRCAVELAGSFENVYATVGVHPHDAKTLSPAHLAALARLAE